ncbi:MAG: histidine kinase [Rhodocyclaceae bacterium]|nr:MAG: histidine kinase [Rhodocyclaceae bacterium]
MRIPAAALPSSPQPTRLRAVFLGGGLAMVWAALLLVLMLPALRSGPMTDTPYFLPATLMLAVALTVGHSTLRLRRHAEIAERKSLLSKTLYEFSRELSGALTATDVADATFAFLASAVGARNAHLIPPAEFAAPPFPVLATRLEACVEQARLNWEPLPDGALHALLPLAAASGTQGVLAFEAMPAVVSHPDFVEYIETVASLVAVALERSRFAEMARETEVRHASEVLRSSILGALSHDLRTPLAALVSMADTAALGKASPERQKRLLEAIRNQAMTICQQMMNLLDMAKLSSGSVELNRAWQPVDEVVGVVLTQIRGQWRDREISVDLPRNLPPVCIDAVLIERVLWNLLENAIKYAPADAPIELAVRQLGDRLEISVSDSGPGLPDGDAGRLFNLFQRGRQESDVAGVGLGLAISRSIVDAHEGEIGASNRLGGGACFYFTLPIGNPPDVLALG